jgi:hypothetical protein
MDANELAVLKMNPTQAVTLRPGRAKWILLFLTTSAFALLGGFIGVSEGELPGYACFLIFGVLAAFSLYQLTSKNIFLELTGTGMRVSSLLRKFEVAWTNVGDIGVVLFRRNIHVVFNYRQRPAEAATRIKQNQSTVHYDEVIPETYGLDAKELAELIASRRDRVNA